jgi:hypothetical protein
LIAGVANCGGDSGGPSYLVKEQKYYYVGNISGAGGCDSDTYLPSTFSELLYPHLTFMNSEFAKFQIETAAADKTASLKIKTSIVCVRGKVIKKITSINPKCPIGYKRK